MLQSLGAMLLYKGRDEGLWRLRRLLAGIKVSLSPRKGRPLPKQRFISLRIKVDLLLADVQKNLDEGASFARARLLRVRGIA